MICQFLSNCAFHPRRLYGTLPTLLLAFCPPPLAAQATSNITVKPVVQLAGAPLGYQRTEMRWNALTQTGDREDAMAGYGGILFSGINQHALAVGFVLRPLGFSVPYVMGVINMDPVTGEAVDEMVQLNDLFQAALNEINATRTDGPWRIAYARAINATGLVTCRLVPTAEPRSYYSNELPAGKAPVPTLTAVADLGRRSAVDGLALLDPSDTGINQDPIQLTESGHVMAMYPAGRRLYERVVGAYRAVTIPAHLANGENNFTINDSLEIFVNETVPGTTTTQLIKYTRQPGSWNPAATGTVNPTWVSSTFWQSSSPSLKATALGEDGSGYAVARYTVKTGKGRTATTTQYDTAFHLSSPILRTPLTNADENVAVNAIQSHRNLSDALVNGQVLPGEEEFVFAVVKNGVRTFQVYKPNYGARFILSDLWLPQNNSVDSIQVSPPLVAGTSSASAYHGGCIGYGTNLSPRRTFILVPRSGQ